MLLNVTGLFLLWENSRHSTVVIPSYARMFDDFIWLLPLNTFRFRFNSRVLTINENPWIYNHFKILMLISLNIKRILMRSTLSCLIPHSLKRGNANNVSFLTQLFCLTCNFNKEDCYTVACDIFPEASIMSKVEQISKIRLNTLRILFWVILVSFRQLSRFSCT